MHHCVCRLKMFLIRFGDVALVAARGANKSLANAE